MSPRSEPPAPADAAARLVFHEVDRARWPDLERFFEARGGPKSCWCMVWRASGPEARRTDGPSRKAALARHAARRAAPAHAAV